VQELGDLSLAPVVIARQARVALGDDIGETMRARVVVMIIGERPGLTVADSLGIYMTLAPAWTGGQQRNCISNIHAQGAWRPSRPPQHWAVSCARRCGAGCRGRYQGRRGDAAVAAARVGHTMKFAPRPEITMSASQEGGLQQRLSVFHLWGIAVGLVISGEYFGWSYGWAAAGTLGFLVATVAVAAMYVAFIFRSPN
jgi:hypothetical protein